MFPNSFVNVCIFTLYKADAIVAKSSLNWKWRLLFTYILDVLTDYKLQPYLAKLNSVNVWSLFHKVIIACSSQLLMLLQPFGISNPNWRLS